MLLSKLLVKLMGSSTSGSKLRLTLPAALFRLPVTLFLFPPFVILGSHKLQDAMPVSLSDPSLGSFPVKTCQEQWFSSCQTRCLQQLVVVRLQRFKAFIFLPASTLLPSKGRFSFSRQTLHQATLGLHLLGRLWENI